ncbi:MAG: hypothetical protein ACREQJ_15520, partial [Candidatus Binatia bacterium]
EGGRELVGAWQVAWSENEVAALWGHRDLTAIAARSAAAPPPVAEWKRETSHLVVASAEHWAFSASGGPLWPRGEATDVKVW